MQHDNICFHSYYYKYTMVPSPVPLPLAKPSLLPRQGNMLDGLQAILRFFVTTCETTFIEGNCHGKCFMKVDWERLLYLFNLHSGHGWNRQQRRNRWNAQWLEYKHFQNWFIVVGLNTTQQRENFLPMRTGGLKKSGLVHSSKRSTNIPIITPLFQLFMDNYVLFTLHSTVCLSPTSIYTQLFLC